MADLTFAQLEGYWIQAGGDKAVAPLMAAIALAESSGDPTATNPTDNNGRQTSWGLWQISNGDHSEPSPNWSDPLENAHLAVAKYASQGLGAWGTYTSGAYKTYLGSAAPVTPTGGSTGGTAKQVTSSSGGFLPDWLSSIFGGDPLSAVLGTVLGPLANVFTNINSALGTGMHMVLWLVNPMNWVRIIAGIAGTAAVIAGAVLIAKAA